MGYILGIFLHFGGPNEQFGIGCKDKVYYHSVQVSSRCIVFLSNDFPVIFEVLMDIHELVKLYPLWYNELTM